MKKAIDELITVKDVSAMTSALKGIGSKNQREHVTKIAAMANKSELISRMNDTDIAKVYFNAEKCDAKYVSKLSVKTIVNTIKGISDLENVSIKIESVVEKGIKSVEEFYKASSGGALNSAGMSGGEKAKTDSQFRNICSALRDAAKASQKVTSVGVKIATVAYKCLVPKTDQQKADYNSSVAAKEYEKKFNKTA